MQIEAATYTIRDAFAFPSQIVSSEKELQYFRSGASQVARTTSSDTQKDREAR